MPRLKRPYCVCSKYFTPIGKYEKCCENCRFKAKRGAKPKKKQTFIKESNEI